MSIEKHFVTFSSPGVFTDEATTVAIDSWDVDAATDMAAGIVERYGATPYAFQFTTRARGDEELDSKVVATSPRYLITGVVWTLQQIIEREDPTDRIMISNMEGNRWDRVIHVPQGGWRNMSDTDVLLDNVRFAHA